MNAAGFRIRIKNYFVIAAGAVGDEGAAGAVGDVVAGAIAEVGIAEAGAVGELGLFGVMPIFACASGIKTLSMAMMLPLLAFMVAPSDFAF